jgi:hypothetical protein
MPYPLVTSVFKGIIPLAAHSAMRVNPAGWLVSAVLTTPRLDKVLDVVGTGAAVVGPVVSVVGTDAMVSAETVDSWVGSPAVSATAVVPVGVSDWQAVPKATRSTGRLSATRQR